MLEECGDYQVEEYVEGHTWFVERLFTDVLEFKIGMWERFKGRDMGNSFG